VTEANRARRSVPGAVVGILLALGMVGPVAGAEDPASAPSLLDSPKADLVVLPPGGHDDPDATPRLLALTAESPAAGKARLLVLQRNAAWDAIATTDLDVGRDELSSRWLVQLGSRRYALIATTPTAKPGTGSAVVIGFDVRDDGGQPSIAEVGRTYLDRAIEDAGAADVDGFGDVELALGLRPAFDASGSCGTTSLRIVDSATFAVRRSIEVPGRLGKGAIGRWDDALGDDLLAYASPDCPPGGTGRTRLSVIRLLDGHESVALDVGPDIDVAAYPPPVRLRVDGAARDLALVGLVDTVQVVDAVAGSQATVGSQPGIPLVAGPDPDAHGAAERIAWMDVDGLHAERIGSAKGKLATLGTTSFDATSLPAGRWPLLQNAIEADVRGHGLSSAWLGDIVDPGCADLVLPGAIMPCGVAELRSGAAWLATRPIAGMSIQGRRAVLVAAGLGWGPDAAFPAAPSPTAGAPDGWWRHGPSTPFAVSEVRGNDVVYYSDFPVPSATIEAAAAKDGSTILPGFTGTRMFVSVAPLAVDEEGPDVAPDLIDGLLQGPTRGSVVRTVRVPVPAGNESGRDGSYATLQLGDIKPAGTTTAARWALQIIPVNDWGEAGFPVVRTIQRDVVGPTVNLDVPFTSPVWPFLANLRGRVEPGSTVSMDGTGPLDVDDRGRFTVVTRLAPWPQAIRLTATDENGNTAIDEFSIVGGIDYRQFPWPLILAVSLLALVAARGMAAAGRNRAGGVDATGWSTGVMDDASRPEIEELPPGKGLPRADGRRPVR
jgi:hypothetical protein